MGYFCFYRLCGKSDDAVNQTLIKTNTGIWSIEYNAEKRTTTFITWTYNFMDCRTTKKVETISTNPGDGERETIIILHQLFLYRGYLQIAACDLTREGSPKLWHILWDPTQHVATRPLAIQQDDTWYCYGWDLTKNICELFQSDGSIGAAYAYAPFGEVTATGVVTQPFQWSSEYHDTELGMVYYNYRHYNPTDGRWVGRDVAKEADSKNLSLFVHNSPIQNWDILGLFAFCKPMCGGIEYDANVYCCRENKLILKSTLPKCRNCKLENEQCRTIVNAEYNRNNQTLEKTLNMALTENSTTMNDMLKDCEKSFGFGSILYSFCVAGVTAAANTQNGIIWATYQVMASLLRSTRNDEYNKCDLAMKDCSLDVIFAINNCECSGN